MSVEERLSEQLDQKDAELEDLRRKIELFEGAQEFERHRWMLHQTSVEPAWQKELPLPRLEMRLSRQDTSWYRVNWDYGIVYQHFTQSFETEKKLLFIPLGRTTGSGGLGKVESQLTLPFRDGLHFKVDSQQFNLPAYFICEEIEYVAQLAGLEHATKEAQKLIRRAAHGVLPTIGDDKSYR